MSKLEKIEKERARKAHREGYQASSETTNIVNTSRQYNFTGEMQISVNICRRRVKVLVLASLCPG